MAMFCQDEARVTGLSTRRHFSRLAGEGSRAKVVTRHPYSGAKLALPMSVKPVEIARQMGWNPNGLVTRI